MQRLLLMSVNCPGKQACWAAFCMQWSCHARSKPSRDRIHDTAFCSWCCWDVTVMCKSGLVAITLGLEFLHSKVNLDNCSGGHLWNQWYHCALEWSVSGWQIQLAISPKALWQLPSVWSAVSPIPSTWIPNHFSEPFLVNSLVPP